MWCTRLKKEKYPQSQYDGAGWRVIKSLALGVLLIRLDFPDTSVL